jgi:hypothetical protein
MQRYPLIDSYNNLLGYIELDDLVAESISKTLPVLGLGYSFTGHEPAKLKTFTLNSRQ